MITALGPSFEMAFSRMDEIIDAWASLKRPVTLTMPNKQLMTGRAAGAMLRGTSPAYEPTHANTTEYSPPRP
jgi:hypothetical protein